MSIHQDTLTLDTMSTLHFSARILIRGVNPYIHVSAARAKTIKSGWKKPLPVLVQIEGKPTEPVRTNMMPVGNGDFYLYLHSGIRRASKTKFGDRVQVTISFDAKYRNGPMHRMPVWFRTPLSNNKKANAAWERLSPSRKKEILRYFAGLKSREARVRNVERALHVLSGNEECFMGRTWNE